jgi:hypothetical protein
MRTAGVPYVVLASEESWLEDADVCAGTLVRHGILVDGVLGTGCKGAPTGAAEQAILWINRMRRHALVVAADLPSGMNGDTGETAGAAVHADVTVTFARPKRCFLNLVQADKVGHLVVADIGIPDEICDRARAAEPCELIALPEVFREHRGAGLGSAQRRLRTRLHPRRFRGPLPRAGAGGAGGCQKRRGACDAGRACRKRGRGGGAGARGDAARAGGAAGRPFCGGAADLGARPRRF